MIRLLIAAMSLFYFSNAISQPSVLELKVIQTRVFNVALKSSFQASVKCAKITAAHLVHPCHLWQFGSYKWVNLVVLV